jgi:hypothetical protein
MLRPRCGKKLRAYRLNRLRPYDYGATPLCGLAEGHNRRCQSEEAVQLLAEKRREKRKLNAAEESRKRTERRREARKRSSLAA